MGGRGALSEADAAMDDADALAACAVEEDDRCVGG